VAAPSSAGRSAAVASLAKPVLAAGAVATRPHPIRGTEVLLIHRKRYDDWTLPKGKTEPGEPLPVCAVREVAEETGVTIRLGAPLDTLRYDAGKAGPKKVDWWGGIPVREVPRPPDDEVDLVTWLPVRAALARLTYGHDRFLVEQHLEQPPTTPLILVRHAKAMDRKDWSRKDSARPINSRGRRQAQLLVPILAAYGILRLVSSTSTRCMKTLLPYAHRQELPIESYAQLSEEVGADDGKGVTKLISRIRTTTLETGTPTVICVHRPVLPHILDALEMAPATLVTGECLVAHLTADGEVHAVERQRPQA
jgi:8-oxo-dGTP pyrophosphatase MutT (NUDIX family)/phosphohistidine phosphatase SixA